MSDLAKHERAAAAQAAYAPAGSRADQVRATSARLIGNVLKNSTGRKEIEVYLAVGAVCPFTSKWDRAIWLEELERLKGQA